MTMENKPGLTENPSGLVRVEAVYEGQLHTTLTHGPSQNTVTTDAPADHAGLGESFSPTDLVASGLASCLLTIMAIAIKDRDIDLKGTRCRVEKTMMDKPFRRIKTLKSTIQFAQNYAPEIRTLLEHAAQACPVHKSLHPDVEAPIDFEYPNDEAV